MEIRRHDEEEVYEASRTGSVEHLNRLIEKDPDILRRLSLQTGKTPLHVSALLGHAEFTKALCTNNPKLAERVDADGRTPLHLASAEGHKETVEALLPVYVDACLRYDEKGRIPLHYAAMNGEVEVLQKLIDKNPESIYVKVENKSKETVLHLCIIHKKLECLKLLVERVDNNGEFLNSRAGCDGGVTILHLALMLRQIKIHLFQRQAISLCFNNKVHLSYIIFPTKTKLHSSVSFCFYTWFEQKNSDSYSK